MSLPIKPWGVRVWIKEILLLLCQSEHCLEDSKISGLKKEVPWDYYNSDPE